MNTPGSTANAITLKRDDIQAEYHLELTPSGEVRVTVGLGVYYVTFATAIRMAHNVARCHGKIVSFD
jgi:hypothetical protein